MGKLAKYAEIHEEAERLAEKNAEGRYWYCIGGLELEDCETFRRLFYQGFVAGAYSALRSTNKK